MLDINGQEILEGATGALLCEVLGMDEEGVRVRILNSEMELVIGCKNDEALGGLVADSEFAMFFASDGMVDAAGNNLPQRPPDGVPTADGSGGITHGS